MNYLHNNTSSCLRTMMSSSRKINHTWIQWPPEPKEGMFSIKLGKVQGMSVNRKWNKWIKQMHSILKFKKERHWSNCEADSRIWIQKYFERISESMNTGENFRPKIQLQRNERHRVSPTYSTLSATCGEIRHSPRRLETRIKSIENSD